MACGPGGFAVDGLGFGPGLRIVVGVALVADQDVLLAHLALRLWRMLVYAVGVVRPGAGQRAHRPALLAVAVAGAVAAGSVLCHLTAESGLW